MKKISHLVILAFTTYFAVFACSKDDSKEVKLPVLTTISVIDITQTTAKSGGNILNDGGGEVTSRGVFWGLEENPTAENYAGFTSDGYGSGIFQSSITNLIPYTNYFLRAYATNSTGTSYGNQIQFSSAGILPTFSIGNVLSITSYSVEISSAVADQGSSSIIKKGHCWSKLHNPTTNDSTTDIGPGGGPFSSNVTGLDPETSYYIRAYAVNSSGTSYGNEIHFTTKKADPVIIFTRPVTEIDYTSALSGGDIITASFTTLIQKGVCWDFNHNPTIDNYFTNDGSATGVYESILSGLYPGTTYFVRAYAISNLGVIYYGSEVSFHTLVTNVPYVTTEYISGLTSTSAIAVGNVRDNGTSAVNSRGVCWSLNHEPTINDPNTLSGSGNGEFTAQITGLLPLETYYVRAFAINNSGIAYGNELEFSTIINPPTITTKAISEIRISSAESGGVISDQGSSTVTQRGVCWSTATNPTIEDFITNDGDGGGFFNSTLTGLTQGTKYYVRAYAINSDEIAYGNELSFTTTSVTNLYVIGNGCSAGWNSNNGLLMEENNGVFTLTTNLLGSPKVIVFLANPGHYAPMYGTDASGTSVSGPLVYRATESDPDPVSIPVPSLAGLYTITVNLHNMTYLIAPSGK